MDWGRNGLTNFNAEKTQLFLFNHLNNSGVFDVKMDGSVLDEKASLKMLELTLI